LTQESPKNKFYHTDFSRKSSEFSHVTLNQDEERMWLSEMLFGFLLLGDVVKCGGCSLAKRVNGMAL